MALDEDQESRKGRKAEILRRFHLVFHLSFRIDFESKRREANNLAFNLKLTLIKFDVKMPRSELKNKTNRFSIISEKSFESNGSLKEVKNVKELRKFFNGFKRAMRFGSS